MLCITVDRNNECTLGNSLVICGYKKVFNGRVYKDVFKVHNSFGKSWQKIHNDGWIDADAIVNNTSRVKFQSDLYVPSASVIWLEP